MRWFLDLIVVAQKEFGYTSAQVVWFEYEEWLPFFRLGYTPQEALAEEIEAAQLGCHSELTDDEVCDLADEAGR